MKFFFPLKYKLIFFTLFFIVASTLTMGLITDSYINDFFIKNTKEKLLEAFSDLSVSLKNIQIRLIENADTLSKDDSIIASLELIKKNEKEKKKIIETLFSKTKEFSGSNIYLYDSNYKLIAFINRGNQQLSQADAKLDMSTQLNVLNNKNTPIKYRNKFNILNLQTVAKISQKYPNDNNTILGYLVMDYNIHVKEINNKETIVIDYYFKSNQNDKMKQDAYSDMPSLFSKFKAENLSLHKGTNTFYSEVFVTLSNDTVIIKAEIDNRESQLSLMQNRKELLTIIVIIILITILISIFILDGIISVPLRELIKGIDIITDGKYSHQISINQHDEFGIISTNFNKMAQEIQKRENDLDLLAYQDILTHIPNRVMFLDQLDYAIRRAERLNTKIAVFFIDIDEFKSVNDTLGHDIGDRLLVKVAGNLVKVMRKNDLLARIGGDEFNVLVEDLDSAILADEIAKKLLKQIQIPLSIDSHAINVTGSIGVAIYPIDASDSTTLLKNADLAMYDAKNSGRNCYKFFSEKLSIAIRERTIMLHEMKLALQKNELKLFYQPKFSLKDGSICGAEALIRWINPILGFVKPERFIPLAEESSEIIQIGAWVIEQACKDFVSWKKVGLNIDQVSVNISNVQFAHSDVFEILERNIKDSGIDAKSLEVEITESYIQENSEEALKVLHKIRKLGVDLAMDDFGTGYSSMSYLKRLPLTRLKIDKAFIDNIPYDHDDVEITKVIVGLAKVMGLSITAEGIETIEQLRFLQKLECDEGQGYICSKALPYEQFVELLKNHTSCIDIS